MMDASSTAPTEEDTPARNFGRAYQEWMEACADLAKLNAGGYEHVQEDEDETEALTGRLSDRKREAECRLITTPAILSCQLIEKFEVMEWMVAGRERDGYPTDNRYMAMLASVKADLYRFEIGRKR